MTAPARIALSFPPALLGEPQAAAYLGISASLLRELVAAGEAPAPVRIRSRRLYRRGDLDAWAASLPSEEERAGGEARSACDRVFGS